MKRTMEAFAKKAEEIEKKSNDPYKSATVKSSLRPRSAAVSDPVKAYTSSLKKQHNVPSYKPMHISVVHGGR